eukprot:2184480-Rhodomonas_salina.2
MIAKYAFNPSSRLELAMLKFLLAMCEIAFPLICPEYPTCSEAKSFCDSKAGLDNLTNFTCHAGSVVGVYTCASNSFPLTDCSGQVALNACEQLPVALGSAEHYSVLAGASVANTGPSSVLGDLGVSPGTAVTGFGPSLGEMLGGSSIDSANIASAAGMLSLTAAYIDAAGRVLCLISKSGDLGGARCELEAAPCLAACMENNSCRL